jgi:lysyl-tRNA synthetase class 1
VTAYHPQDNTVQYACDRPTAGPGGERPGCGHRDATTVLGGEVKVGWKADWALRWYSYDVDYEMHGKDLIESAKLSARVVKLMGKKPPTGLVFELFLDEEGRKISKSVGRGLSVDSWVSYAPLESLLYFLYQNPKRAKRLYWETVPKSADDYLAELVRYPTLSGEEQKNSAIWHIFDGGKDVPQYGSGANYTLITNIIAGTGSDDEALIWDFLERYDSSAAADHDTLADLIHRALRYYRDEVLPHKHFRTPTETEKGLLRELRDAVVAHPGEDEQELQSIPFDIARSHDMNPRELFRTVYEVLLGQERGPRFGTLVKLVGKEQAVKLLDRVLGA